VKAVHIGNDGQIPWSAKPWFSKKPPQQRKFVNQVSEQIPVSMNTKPGLGMGAMLPHLVRIRIRALL